VRRLRDHHDHRIPRRRKDDVDARGHGSASAGEHGDASARHNDCGRHPSVTGRGVRVGLLRPGRRGHRAVGDVRVLRLPRLKLAHDPDNVPEDVVPGSECEWWWRVRVVNANRSWGLFVPRTAKGVEVFVTSLRRTHDADGNRVESDDSLDMPVVSGRRIPWTIPRKDKKADPDGIAPVSIPAGTFRYLSAIGPRYTGDGEARTRRAFYALHLKPGTTAGRYDIDQRQGIWVAKLVVSADDVRARRWRITIRLAAPSDSEDRPKDAVTLTLSSSQAVRS
jgi:hypothetical protein